MKPVVIFDFDGTIADSYEYVIKFLCREAGKPADFYEKQAELYRGKSMYAIAVSLGIPRWRLLSVFFKGRRIMRRHLMEVMPFIDMVEVLQQIHASGGKLFIVSSNSRKNVRMFLRHYNIDGYFTWLYCNSGFFGKPPKIRRLLRRYKVDKNDCYFVGDEIGDMLAAKQVGVHGIGASWGFADKDMLAKVSDTEVKAPKEILKVIGLTWKK